MICAVHPRHKIKLQKKEPQNLELFSAIILRVIISYYFKNKYTHFYSYNKMKSLGPFTITESEGTIKDLEDIVKRRQETTRRCPLWILDISESKRIIWHLPLGIYSRWTFPYLPPVKYNSKLQTSYKKQT